MRLYTVTFVSPEVFCRFADELGKSTYFCSITHLALCPFPKEDLKVLSLLDFGEQGPYQLGLFGCPGQRRDI
jgi:hypothetical protein